VSVKEKLILLFSLYKKYILKGRTNKTDMGLQVVWMDRAYLEDELWCFTMANSDPSPLWKCPPMYFLDPLKVLKGADLGHGLWYRPLAGIMLPTYHLQ
jgi:hypothetical protein